MGGAVRTRNILVSNLAWEHKHGPWEVERPATKHTRHRLLKIISFTYEQRGAAYMDGWAGKNPIAVPVAVTHSVTLALATLGGLMLTVGNHFGFRH